ncbi:hypothetical protein DICVIV_08652 [Dictyocaulus viviparus]|uniref:Uncharacterized protein n=1 Tax=Dictyocaulus viviparus TaxID=29172 RepID=A0A0D8XL97_DICVI|nr:hypothetical protein DICVIV_08652 [Dictyocaulus viviparus]
MSLLKGAVRQQHTALDPPTLLSIRPPAPRADLKSINNINMYIGRDVMKLCMVVVQVEVFLETFQLRHSLQRQSQPFFITDQKPFSMH